MNEGWPKIKARNTKRISPWMAIIEREVEFAPGAEREIYHAVSQQDYITIVAALPDSRLPIVRQYRPTLESFTWGIDGRARRYETNPMCVCRDREPCRRSYGGDPESQGAARRSQRRAWRAAI